MSSLRLVAVPRESAAIAWKSDGCEAWDEIARDWSEVDFMDLTQTLGIDGLSECARYLTDGRPCVIFPEVVITAVGYDHPAYGVVRCPRCKMISECECAVRRIVRRYLVEYWQPGNRGTRVKEVEAFSLMEARKIVHREVAGSVVERIDSVEDS